MGPDRNLLQGKTEIVQDRAHCSFDQIIILFFYYWEEEHIIWGENHPGGRFDGTGHGLVNNYDMSWIFLIFLPVERGKMERDLRAQQSHIYVCMCI